MKQKHEFEARTEQRSKNSSLQIENEQSKTQKNKKNKIESTHAFTLVSFASDAQKSKEIDDFDHI